MLIKIKVFHVFTLLVMLGVIPITHADSATDDASIAAVKKETQDLLQALNAYTVEQKTDAMRSTKAALDNLDKRIDALQSSIDKNWDKMDKAARKQARTNLDALRKERSHLAEWYASLKNSTAGAWEHMKQGFSKSYQSLNEAWEKSVDEFRSNK